MTQRFPGESVQIGEVYVSEKSQTLRACLLVFLKTPKIFGPKNIPKLQKIFFGTLLSRGTLRGTWMASALHREDNTGT